VRWFNVDDGARRHAGPESGTAHLVLATAAAVLAGVARLVPVLRGGGLAGLGNYDDGVYYASGTALLNGILPYRDYVFLHPPGIVVMLAPFGLAGQDTTAQRQVRRVCGSGTPRWRSISATYWCAGASMW